MKIRNLSIDIILNLYIRRALHHKMQPLTLNDILLIRCYPKLHGQCWYCCPPWQVQALLFARQLCQQIQSDQHSSTNRYNQYPFWDMLIITVPLDGPFFGKYIGNCRWFGIVVAWSSKEKGRRQKVRRRYVLGCVDSFRCCRMSYTR